MSEFTTYYNAILASGALMTALTARFGFTRIIGLGHLFWIPLVAFLILRLGAIPADDFFGLWIRAVIVLNSIALAIDAVDVVRWLAGDRQETVAGL